MLAVAGLSLASGGSVINTPEGASGPAQIAQDTWALQGMYLPSAALR